MIWLSSLSLHRRRVWLSRSCRKYRRSNSIPSGNVSRGGFDTSDLLTELSQGGERASTTPSAALPYCTVLYRPGFFPLDRGAMDGETANEEEGAFSSPGRGGNSCPADPSRPHPQFSGIAGLLQLFFWPWGDRRPASQSEDSRNKSHALATLQLPSILLPFSTLPFHSSSTSSLPVNSLTVSIQPRYPTADVMEALLRQSQAMCPFLKKTSPATLRTLSTSTARQHAAPGGGAISNLQVLAKRCPIMGKAMTTSSSRLGNTARSAAFSATRAYHGKVPRANLHTTSPKEAQPVNDTYRNRREHMPFSAAMAHSSTVATDPARAHAGPPAPPARPQFDYAGFYQNELDKKHKDKSYRYFNNINRLAQDFPRAHMATPEERVDVWCSNDYL
nr:5-aminolevulinate synthase, mitochondrial [Quercus suber]